MRGDKGEGDRGSIGLQNQNPDCCLDHSWYCGEKDLNIGRGVQWGNTARMGMPRVEMKREHCKA